MEVTDDDYCLVCGTLNEIGLKTRPQMNPENKSATCRLAIPRQFQGWRNIVHGGILATLLDETSAYAGKTLARHVVTAEMTVRYKKPVAVESQLEIHAVVVSQRKRILEIAARLEVNGVIHAEADVKMFIVE